MDNFIQVQVVVVDGVTMVVNRTIWLNLNHIQRIEKIGLNADLEIHQVGSKPMFIRDEVSKTRLLYHLGEGSAIGSAKE